VSRVVSGVARGGRGLPVDGGAPPLGWERTGSWGLAPLDRGLRVEERTEVESGSDTRNLPSDLPVVLPCTVKHQRNVAVDDEL